MKIEITNETQNLLLERQEIEFKITDSKLTPSREEIIKKISAIKNSKEELIIIDPLQQEFGKQIITGKAKIKKSKEKLNSIELKPVKKKHEPKKASEEKKTETTVEKKEGEQ